MFLKVKGGHCRTWFKILQMFWRKKCNTLIMFTSFGFVAWCMSANDGYVETFLYVANLCFIGLDLVLLLCPCCVDDLVRFRRLVGVGKRSQLGQKTCFGRHKHIWRCPELSLNIFSVTLTNVETRGSLRAELHQPPLHLWT